MQEITANLSSPAWWFSAVIVALLINMISAYTKPWTDGLFSQLNSRWRTRTDAKRRQFDEAVELRVLNTHLLRDSAEKEVRLRQQSVFMLLLALFLLFFSELSGIAPKSGQLGLTQAFVTLLLLSLKLLGMAMTVGSIAVSNSADRHEAIIHKANVLLAAIQDARREKLEDLERKAAENPNK